MVTRYDVAAILSIIQIAILAWNSIYLAMELKAEARAEQKRREEAARRKRLREEREKLFEERLNLPRNGFGIRNHSDDKRNDRNDERYL